MSMDDALFNLKFQSKHLQRLANKKEKEYEKNKKIVAKYIKAGDADRAKIYAETATRNRAEGNQYLKMSAQIDGVRGRLEMLKAEKALVKVTAKMSKSIEKVFCLLLVRCCNVG